MLSPNKTLAAPDSSIKVKLNMLSNLKLIQVPYSPIKLKLNILINLKLIRVPDSPIKLKLNMLIDFSMFPSRTRNIMTATKAIRRLKGMTKMPKANKTIRFLDRKTLKLLKNRI